MRQDYTRVDRVPLAIRQAVHTALRDVPFTAQTAELVAELEAMAYTLRAEVLAQQLPPQHVSHTFTDSREVQVTGHVDHDRFTTWWDHFKATHRGRWWMRWRTWQVNTTPVSTPYAHTHTLRCGHKVTVPVRAMWKYPQATVAPPELGRPVMYATVDKPTVHHVATWTRTFT